VHHHVSQFHFAMGDVPTWLLFVGAAVATATALRQLRIQQSDSASNTRQLERQQANDVDSTWCAASRVIIFSSPPGQIAQAARCFVIISNGSRRPIRNVTAWIHQSDGQMRLDPIMLGVIGEPQSSGHDYALYDPRPMTSFPLVRPGAQYGFLFDYEIPEDDARSMERRADRPMIQFVDDAELTWQIDDDLRLRKVDHQRGLMHRLRQSWHALTAVHRLP